MKNPLNIVILGLSITSSWGNGHATTYRGIVKGLAARGHNLLFLERNVPWYAGNRDEPQPPGCTTRLYDSPDQLISEFESSVSQADLVIVGSYIPDGIQVGEWVQSVACGRTAFYDIDTPVTLFLLESGTYSYISPDLIPRYDAYFSFTGGPTLSNIESSYGSPMARTLYCVVDHEIYKPLKADSRWGLGYMGTYSSDRQPALEKLLLATASRFPQERFAVAGPQYPEDIEWPSNVERITHLASLQHPGFYASQRFTLNITREAMKQAGFSPSVRLFEAAACATPIISDWWPGLDSIFNIGSEILVAETTEDVLRYLRDTTEIDRIEIGIRSRQRVLAEHSPVARAIQIENYLEQMNDCYSGARRDSTRSFEAVSVVPQH